MKKLLALLMTAVMVFALVSCFPDNSDENKDPNKDDPNTPGDKATVMTYDEYMAAEVNDEVLVEVYVQATQSWWFDKNAQKGKITVYAADEDGAYFLYEMACSEEDAAKLVPGTKIRVNGYKAEWSGEIEIVDATFEFVDGDPYIAEAVDLTDVLGTEDLIDYQNQFAYFDSLTVESIEFKNGKAGDDIYVKLSKDGKTYNFCVEAYLTGPDTELYQSVSALETGDVIHVEGFLYWYEGVNTHITAVYNGGVLSYDEYVAAKINQHVKVEMYVQAHQSWWDNKITVYAADEDGAYFLYEMACSEEDAAKLVPGTKILVDGYKGEWAGEVEIMDATFEFVTDIYDPYLASAKDVTAYLGTDELINYQNQFVSFSGLTIEGISYKNDGGDDIYVTVGYNGATYDFCVEVYLTGTDTEVYQAVQALDVGDVVDIEGFLYWYEGVNTHITSVTVE